MATKSVANPKSAPKDIRGNGSDLYHNVIDGEAAASIFKAMSVLAMGIEATTARSLDRAYLQWPSTAEAAWDMLDGILVRAGISDGKERPWVSADEDDEANEAEAGAEEVRS